MDSIPRRKCSFAHSALAAGMNGLESTVHLLHNRLHVVSIEKRDLPSATHTLLQLLLKLFGAESESRRDRFFSFTETVADYSIILDDRLLEVLAPPGSDINLDVSHDIWRPLVVEVGALGSVSGISKLAASVISPLADQHVSVFCLSTNLDDYVMVKECDLQKALCCLAKRFKLTCDSSRGTDIEIVRTVGRSCGLDSPIRKTAPAPSNLVITRPVVHPYVCSSTLYSICRVVPSALNAIGSTLLHYMLFREKSKYEPFFSLSIIEEDISLVMDSSQVNQFPSDSLYLSETAWRMIRIGDGPLGFDECGIVAQVSSPLALAEISTFYICTFQTDHTLIPATMAQEALTLLNHQTSTKHSRPS